MAATVRRTVSGEDTAAALGSGDVPVLATPRLLAWAEAATVAAVGDALPSGTTSVGTRVELEHLVASPVGATVTVAADLVEVSGRRLHFAITAHDEHGRMVGRGDVHRAVVDRGRFLAGE